MMKSACLVIPASSDLRDPREILRNGKTEVGVAATQESILKILRQWARQGIQRITILSSPGLPKKLIQDEIPNAIREVRSQYLDLDFHYVGLKMAGKG